MHARAGLLEVEWLHRKPVSNLDKKWAVEDGAGPGRCY